VGSSRLEELLVAAVRDSRITQILRFCLCRSLNHEPWYPHNWRTSLDRGLLISWLLKDLGWMTTNVYLAWSFGAIAVILHVIVLIVDWKFSIPFRFYHVSLLLWIVGNFLWMCVEFMLNKESSAVHFGPHTPLGGMSVETGHCLTSAKSYLFLIAIGIQFALYFCIHVGLVEMPPDESGKNYGYSLSDGSFHSQGDSEENSTHFEPNDRDHQSLVRQDEKENDTEDIFPSHRYPMGFSLTLIENCYIVLWISKDYFWSWATGDFKINQTAGIFTGQQNSSSSFIVVMFLAECVSMLFGILSVALFAYVTYCWRHHFVNMMDSLTSFCWLSANLVWMGGEVFIRFVS
jgi:hypothetical protein